MKIINADKLHYKQVYIQTEKGLRPALVVFAKEIRKMPDIVRCEDCKYGEPNGQYGCKCYHYKLYDTHEMSPTDFCSHAERRKNGKID